MRPSPAQAVTAVLAWGIIIAAIVAGGFSDRISRPMLINSDSAGMDTGETFSAYTERARQTLGREGTGFALVTFASALPDAELGPVVDRIAIDRLCAFVAVGSAPVPAPEPVAPEVRSDVLARLRQTTPNFGPRTASIVVWGSMEQIRQLAADPEVAAVEALPADAAWGRFGIRPVTVG